VSEYPATLGDLSEVEARLDARLSQLEKRQGSDTQVTDDKIADIRQRLALEIDKMDEVARLLIELVNRVRELERLWRVARENPELVRELAAEALKGRGAG